jgi:hypothetical protein
LVGISFIKDSIRPNEKECSENSGSRSQDSKDLAKIRKQEPRLEESCDPANRISQINTLARILFDLK